MTDSQPTTLIRAAAARDAAGVNLRPAMVLIHEGVIVATGRDTSQHPAARHARVIDLPQDLLLPAMVNAHAHLDLTAIGPREFDGNFSDWVGCVMRDRPGDDVAISGAVEKGLALSRAAGVGWVGDIAGSDAAARAFIESATKAGIGGTTWLECFGIGERAADAGVAAVARCKALANAGSGDVRVDLQPHAPYSAGLPLYEAVASRRNVYPCTHLAETHAEAQFIRDAAGPFADLLRRLGKWDASITPRHMSPVQHLSNVLSLAPWLVAHCNYVSDDDIAILAVTGTSVAYCPVASEYFQHVDHRYRDMLAAGVNVCLGTDSILCQPPAEPQPMGLLPAMRRLHQRDGTDPGTLLAMATTHGSRALALPANTATLAVGAPARLVAIRIDPQSSVDPLTQAMRSDYPVQTIAWR